MKFDWHGGTISPATEIDSGYKNTQNVRRFLSAQCGPDFKFDRKLMAWMRNGAPKSMADVVAEWHRRHGRQ
ncbi:MAG: DUF6434 domain-containing protein [Pseudomonadota bacterium]|jgi:hypothetical protein